MPCSTIPNPNPNLPGVLCSFDVGPNFGPGTVPGTEDQPGATVGPLPVNLRTAACYVALAGSTITNTGPSVLDDKLGLSPGGSVTGFPPGTVPSQDVANPAAVQAKLDLTDAYLEIEARNTDVITVAGNIGGQTLVPGLYKSTSSLAVSSGDLTLDALGNTEANFIFQVASTFTMTPGRQIILAGGAQAKNVFFQVGSSATIQTTAVLNGQILALSSITAETGAVINGRLLARNAAVTLDSNPVTSPSPCVA